MKMVNIYIRLEEEKDYKTVEHLTREAFLGSVQTRMHRAFDCSQNEKGTCFYQRVKLYRL